MNLLQLKYILEVEKTQSITKAAENLYMGQPNLSRSIKELEDKLGFAVFNRTSHGMVPTLRGEEVLEHAKKAIAQVDAIEDIGNRDNNNSQRFSISVPRVSYISHAFTLFAASLDMDRPIELDYIETNSMQAVENVISHSHDLGIIRFKVHNELAFISMLRDRELAYETVTEFTYKICMSEKNPLAMRSRLVLSDLRDQIELVHGDPFIPTLSRGKALKQEIPDLGNKRIYLYERGGQFDILCEVPNTFMWVSPLPEGLKKRNGVVVKDCGNTDESWTCRDVIFHKSDAKLSQLSELFIEKLDECKRDIFGVHYPDPDPDSEEQ